MSQPATSPAIDRRTFLRRSTALGTLAALGPLHALGKRVARGRSPLPAFGYGPLVNKGDLWLPEGFEYQIISWQGKPMSDGNPTPGIFDGMGAFPDSRRSCEPLRTILIRNHENRDFGDEIRVITDPSLEYDPSTWGGNTKLVVERRFIGRDPDTLCARFEYNVIRDFAILGGTTTNCAGGEMPFKKWVTCEEVVKRSPNGRKHGYVFEIDGTADSAVPAIPVLAAGRMAHEAVAWRGGILYLTEDRGISGDPLLGLVGACFYRYIPDRIQTRSSNLALGKGQLQALKIVGENHANMNEGRTIGASYRVEWVTVDDPDHDDDSDFRTDRVPGFIPTRIQAQDKGAAFFNRLEGAWAVGIGASARVYFDCTSGGPAGLGQIWEYDPSRRLLRLIYESTDPIALRNPDNISVVPQTQDIFLCEDGGGEQFVRGLTRRGQIYNFVKTDTNQSEFCGACFDRGGHTLYLNQQGERGMLPGGPTNRAVTYAIYGPFRKRRL